jgi:tripartite-type tricarboxylate transporter receptor subunit TctC
MTRRTLLASCMALALAALAALPAQAADPFPVKPVRLIAPFPAGGSADTYARLLAQELSALWKQPVVVDNKAGAGGVIGQQALLAAPADGYTIIIVSNSFAINPLINPKLPYADKDFTPVVQVAATANMLIVPAESKYKTLKDLIDDARAHPAALSYGMAGNGTSPHIAGENFKYTAKLDIVAVPYRGNAPVVADVVANQIPMGFANVVDVLQFVKGGKMRALAAGGKTRAPQMPDVPTFDESGVKNFESVSWFVVIASAATPPAIVDQLNRDINTVWSRPAVRSRIEDSGSVVLGGSQAAAVRFIEAEKQRLSPVIKAANIRGE